MWVQQFEDLGYHARTLRGQIGVERPFDVRQFFAETETVKDMTGGGFLGWCMGSS